MVMNNVEDTKQQGPQEHEARLFTERFKMRNRLIASSGVVFASATPFTLGLFIITYLVPDPTDWLAGVVMLGAFLAAGAFTWLVQNRVSFLGNGWLSQELRRRLSDSELFAHFHGPTSFVGFAPGEEILMWAGETDLDVGFLHLGDGGLTFAGDRFNWSLNKDRIDRIDLVPAPTGLRRVVIHWHAPRQAGRSFTVGSRQASSLREADQETISLFKNMRRWLLRRPQDDSQLPAAGYPPTDQHGGRPIDQPAAGWCAVTVSMMLIIVLTTWYLVEQMLADGYYYHAALWAGFVFVGGTVFTRCLLHYLQASSPQSGRGERTQ